MRKLLTAAVLGVACVAWVAAPARAQVRAGKVDVMLPDTVPLDGTSRAILRHERRRVEAISARDTAALRTLYAPEVRVVLAVGTALNRDQLLEAAAGDDPSSRYLVDELAVRILDPARRSAILSGRLRRFDGARTQSFVRYLQVYQQRGGRWQIVATEETPIVAR